MAAKPENTFIASVHRHLPPLSEFYRMKNHNDYIAGVADCWYSSRSDLWVEYKFIKIPARISTVVVPGLSDLQLDWCESRRREGRNVQVIVGCKEGGVVLQQAEWRGLTAGDFRARLITRQQVAQYLLKETS